MQYLLFIARAGVILFFLSFTIVSCKPSAAAPIPSSDESEVDPGQPVPDPVAVPGDSTSQKPLSDDVFFIGHSLVGTVMPNMLTQVVASQSGGSGQSIYQVINGSPLAYNWDHSASAQGNDARVVLPAGNHEVVVMTEAVPLYNHTTYSDSNGNALLFYNLAISGNSNTRVYLYETWHCLTSGTPTGCAYDTLAGDPWRARLDIELPRWEGIMNSVNGAKAPGAPAMRIIPAGQAMAKMYDEIQAGRVPGITNIQDLFADEIHPNEVGFYFVTMVQYAAIYGRNPLGLPNTIADINGGGNFDVPSTALAVKMQQIAWQVVCAYTHSGVTCQ